MSDDGRLVEAVISGVFLGLTGSARKKPSGKQFTLSYLSGHPTFPVPDDGGSVFVGKDKLRYIFGSRSDLAFEVPLHLIHSVQLLQPATVTVRLQGADKVPLDLEFGGDQRHARRLAIEIQRKFAPAR